MLPLRRFFVSKVPKTRILKDRVEIFWSAVEKPSIFHFAWLRDHCPTTIHHSTQQKLHSSGSILSPEPAIITWSSESPPQLYIKWKPNSLISNSADHSSTFSIDWLKNNDYSVPPKKLIDPVLWKAKDYSAIYNPIDYNLFRTSDEHFRKIIADLRDFGLAYLKNVPTSNLIQVEEVAKRFGVIRETFYGVSWDVKNMRDAKNIAYTSLDLGLHMDLMYFESPPGLQMLHCIENTVKGGESTFLDVFNAVHQLKQESQEHYEILKKVPVTFHYKNDGHHLIRRRPTIIDDDQTEGLKVYYAPPFQGPLHAPPDIIKDFYVAFNHFESIIQRPEFLFKRKLEKGQCVIFANQRVLHGRDAFDSASGDRHFRGTYVGVDEFMDKLRVLGLGSKVVFKCG